MPLNSLLKHETENEESKTKNRIRVDFSKTHADALRVYFSRRGEEDALVLHLKELCLLQMHQRS